MSASISGSGAQVRGSGLETGWRAGTLDSASTAFGLSAAIVIVFNTLLVWGKESYGPLNGFMAALTGHHWITHGLVDVLLFIGLGALFLARGVQMPPAAVVIAVAAAAVFGGAGIAGWFLFL